MPKQEQPAWDVFTLITSPPIPHVASELGIVLASAMLGHFYLQALLASYLAQVFYPPTPCNASSDS